MPPLVDPDFWRGRSVLVTGHTGFKGAWLSLWLQAMGARVSGLAAGSPTAPSLFELARVGGAMTEIGADVRDHGAVLDALARQQPEVVVHMAAQPLVRRSLADPRATFQINVMGTVNVLEAVRATPSVRAVVNVTSDKCYANPGNGRPFTEDDPLGGNDPYSSSKGCAELVAHAYASSFFSGRDDGPRLGSARAGNVVGGGDWGADRLVPDLVRGALAGEPAAIRNPDAIRPWQHVLNPLSGYLTLAQALHGAPEHVGAWNFGPAPDDARSVRWLADRLGELWPGGELRWAADARRQPAEAQSLELDCTKARERLGWVPALDLDAALRAIVDWYGALHAGADMREATLAQIADFSQTRAGGAT